MPRLPDGEKWPVPDGSYWRMLENRHPFTGAAWYWYVVTPNGMLGCLASHQVVEHEDGTITVTPSILITGGDSSKSWHGYLEHGAWREC